MGHKVHANGLEVACKASDGKTPAAFPDVCKTPAPPGAPVPLPYPNTAVASDTDKASKHIKINSKPVMLGRKSCFKSSTGDEAGKVGGVASNTTKGAAYFAAHSMNVKFEGEPAVRNLDVTTHNHAPSGQPGNTPPWPFLAGTFASGVGEPCDKENEATAKACDPWTNRKDKCKPSEAERSRFKQLGRDKNLRKKSHGADDDVFKQLKGEWNKAADVMADALASDPCSRKLRCYLTPYKPGRCCPGQTGHHLVEASALIGNRKDKANMSKVPGIGDYDPDAAPCICVEGENQNQGTHGLMHTYQSTAAGYMPGADGHLVERPATKLTMTDGKTYTGPVTTYGEARDQGVEAVKKSFPESGCDPECLKSQLDAYHTDPKVGVKEDTPCKAVVTGKHGTEAASAADAAVLLRTDRMCVAISTTKKVR